MEEIERRIRAKKLLGKIVSAEQAAQHIKAGMNIGTSGFTPAGYPKAVPLALAKRMEKEPFTINLWTGASVGKELDGALAKVGGIKRRMPYQTDKELRNAINDGNVEYCDLHLSESAQLARYGFMGGKIDIAIIEACAITEEGHIIPTTSMGNAASFVKTADKVIIEINTTQPVELEGMHDAYVPLDPPHRKAIPIEKANDRIGTPHIECGEDKILCIVPCDIKDDVRPFGAIDENSHKMSQHIIDFFHKEIKERRLPKNLLPLQSGVGNVANAVISGFVDSDLTDLEVYTEVIQDGMFDLIDAGKLKFASGTSLSPSPSGLERFYRNIKQYRQKLLLRPQEIANSPEIARRIGIIAMNTAIEFDIYGNVNSTHIMGTKMMNGIGGSGDFARNAYLTCFFSTSTAKGGLISSIVPMCSHIDHTEHDTDIFVTEIGLADVRGMSPRERARCIIENCAHPDYKQQLMDYLKRAEQATGRAHTPHIIEEALSWHQRYLKTGSMKQ